MLTYLLKSQAIIAVDMVQIKDITMIWLQGKKTDILLFGIIQKLINACSIKQTKICGTSNLPDIKLQLFPKSILIQESYNKSMSLFNFLQMPPKSSSKQSQPASPIVQTKVNTVEPNPFDTLFARSSGPPPAIVTNSPPLLGVTQPNLTVPSSPLLSRKPSRITIEHGDYSCECSNENEEGRGISGEVHIKDKNTGLMVYEGQFFNSKKNGFGIEYNSKGEVAYQGEFRAGKKDGWGKSKQYEGQWKEDDHDGWGKYITNQIFYEGYFIQGRYNGMGVYIKAKTDQTFKNLQQLRNKTRMDDFLAEEMSKDSNLFSQFNIEEIYIGQWTKGLKNGSGKLWMENQFWYSGQFSYDTIHGNGTMSRLDLKQSDKRIIQRGVFSKGQFKTSV